MFIFKTGGVDDVSRLEKKENAAPAPRPLDPAGRGTTEPLTFRGEPIAWQTIQQTRTVVTENPFGEDEISERPGRREQLIIYGGSQHKKEAFYKMAFP